MNLVDDSTCFVCGKENKNGLQLDIHMDEASGTAYCSCVIMCSPKITLFPEEHTSSYE